MIFFLMLQVKTDACDLEYFRLRFVSFVVPVSARNLKFENGIMIKTTFFFALRTLFAIARLRQIPHRVRRTVTFTYNGQRRTGYIVIK